MSDKLQFVVNLELEFFPRYDKLKFVEHRLSLLRIACPGIRIRTPKYPLVESGNCAAGGEDRFGAGGKYLTSY